MFCEEMNDAAFAMRKKAFAMIDGKLQQCLRTVEQDSRQHKGQDEILDVAQERDRRNREF